MNERQLRTTERLKAALTFLDRHPFANGPALVNGMRDQLEQSLARISEAEDVQVKFPLTGRGRVDFRRDELRRKKLIPLRRIALPLFKNIPGAGTALRVPATHAGATTVAAAAKRMVDYLLPRAGFLRSAGITKDFLLELKQEARTLALSTKEFEAVRRKRSAATKTVKAEITKGLGALSTLEGLVLLHAPEHAAGWKIATGVQKKIGRPRKVRPRRRPAPWPELRD